MASEDDPLITLTEAKAFLAAEFGLNISRPTLKRWAIRGVRGLKLEARIYGDWWYTRRSAVRAFLDARNNAPATEPVGVSPGDLRKAVQARRELERRGCLREKKTEVLGVQSTRGGSRALHG